MDWSGLPTLNSLRAFAALAQSGNFVGAGKALNVTHAAVSQQVRGLEESLGIKLVIRSGRGMALTAEGMQLARDLDTGFRHVRHGVDRLRQAGLTRPVQLSTSPAFAMEWLMPRIQAFQSAHPDIPLMLNPTSKIMDLRPGGVEVAVRYSDRHRLKEKVNPVLVSDMVVIAHPQLIGERSIASPRDLVDFPWLQELGTTEVDYWFGLHGVENARPQVVTQMPGNLIMQAVRRGDGITFTARAFFEEELRTGRMQALFSLPAFGIYYLATGRGPRQTSVSTFIDWLMAQAGRCVTQEGSRDFALDGETSAG